MAGMPDDELNSPQRAIASLSPGGNPQFFAQTQRARPADSRGSVTAWSLAMAIWLLMDSTHPATIGCMNCPRRRVSQPRLNLTFRCCAPAEPLHPFLRAHANGSVGTQLTAGSQSAP